MVRPTSFRFGSCTSPIFTGNGPAGFYFNVPRSGGNRPGDRGTRPREILTREESPEHDGDPDELADVERPGNVVPGEGAAGGVMRAPIAIQRLNRSRVRQNEYAAIPMSATAPGIVNR